MSTASRQVWNWRHDGPAELRARHVVRLRSRGLLGGVVAMLVGTVLNLILGHVVVGRVLVAVGAAQALVAVRRPDLLDGPLTWLSRFGLAVGTALAWLLLTPLWLLVFVPGGIWQRLMGRDPLQRAPLAAGLTAWIPRRRVSDVRSAGRQFQDEDREALALNRPDGTLPASDLLTDVDGGGGPA